MVNIYMLKKFNLILFDKNRYFEINDIYNKGLNISEFNNICNKYNTSLLVNIYCNHYVPEDLKFYFNLRNIDIKSSKFGDLIINKYFCIEQCLSLIILKTLNIQDLNYIYSKYINKKHYIHCEPLILIGNENNIYSLIKYLNKQYSYNIKEIREEFL